MTLRIVLPFTHVIVRFFTTGLATGALETATGAWVGVADGVGVAVGDAVALDEAVGAGAPVTSGPR